MNRGSNGIYIITNKCIDANHTAQGVQLGCQDDLSPMIANNWSSKVLILQQQGNKNRDKI